MGVTKRSGKHSLVLNLFDSLNKYEVDLLSRKIKIDLDKDFISQINSLNQVQMRVK